MSRLLVLGNAGLDLGLGLLQLPQPGETVLGRARGRAPGGKGLNQATVAARCALLPVLFHAPLGPDPEGDEVARTLAAEPFAALALPRLAAPTDLSVLLVLPDGENAIVSAGDCAHALPPEAAAAFAGQAQPGDWLLLQGNLLPEATAAAIAAAHDRGAQVALNAAPAIPGLRDLLPRCDLLVANAAEAQLFAPLCPAAGGVAIVTLGAEGCRVTAGGTQTHHPAALADTVDTTGAGDTFCGVLLAALAAGRAPGAAVAAAQGAAAITVGRPGAFAALPTAAELRPLLR